MTMTPQEFRDLFDSAVAHEPPLRQQDDVATGAAMLRRRRAALAGGAVALAVIVGGVGYALGTGDDRADRDSAPAVVELPPLEQQLELCREAGPAPAQSARFFEGGTPTVMASTATQVRGELVLESADGTRWAACSLRPGADEDAPAMMLVYLKDGEASQGIRVDLSGISWDGVPCGAPDEPGECGYISVRFANRLRPGVASVRLELANGDTMTADTHEGYVVAAYYGPMPESAETDEPFHPVRRVFYLDEDGDPVAAEGFYTAEERRELVEERVRDITAVGDIPPRKDFHYADKRLTQTSD